MKSYPEEEKNFKKKKRRVVGDGRPGVSEKVYCLLG
jgi:hypothetical protein